MTRTQFIFSYKSLTIRKYCSTCCAYASSTMPKHFECRVCGRRIEGHQNFSEHTFQCKKRNVGDQCSTSSSIQRVNRRQPKETESKKECLMCKKTISRATDMARHMKSCKGIQAVATKSSGNRCVKCGKTYSRPDNLKRHLATCMTRKNNYKCNKCETSFSNVYNLKRHASVSLNRYKLYQYR